MARLLLLVVVAGMVFATVGVEIGVAWLLYKGWRWMLKYVKDVGGKKKSPIIAESKDDVSVTDKG